MRRPLVPRLGLVVPMALALGLGLFQNCSSMQPLAFAVNAGSSFCTVGGDGACVAASAARCVFNGSIMADGASVTAFLQSSVAAGAACTPQARTCHSGALTGTYAYASCVPGGAPACLFGGRTIPSGQSVTAFLSSTGTCTSQTRTCTSGALSGSYAFDACTPSGNASCLFNGQTIAHGASVIAYAASQVSSGGACQSQLRTCYNGALSGAGDFATCTVGGAASCLLGGTTVASGQSVTAYASSTAPAGSSCQPTTRTCTNGTLSGAGNFTSCVAGAAASCLINGQTIPSGGSITLYAAPAVGVGQTCQAEVRTCANGSLSGSATSASCVVATSASFGPTTLTAGQSLASGTLTLTMQADGNLVATDAARGRVVWSTHTGGASCAAGCKAMFQSEGNLVLYNGGSAFWSSQSAGFANAQLVLSVTAPYVSVQSNGQTVWAGNTDLNFIGGLSNIAGMDWGPGYPGGPSRTGESDFMNLFTENSGWSNALSHLNVFKLYTQQIVNNSDDDLRKIVSFLNAHHIAIAVEMPPMVYAGQNPACLSEGVTGAGLVDQIAQKLQANGGTLAYVSMDEPIDAMYAQNANGVDCGFSTHALAAGLSIQSYNRMRAYFPAVQFGDIENGLSGDMWAPFVDAWRQQTGGVPLAFVHDDALIDTAYWQQKTPGLQQMLKDRQIPYGLILDGPCSADVPDGNAWNGWVIGRMMLFRQLGFATPDNYQIQSWCSAPTVALPETSPVSLTYILNWLFPPTTVASGFDAGAHPIYRSVNAGADHLYTPSASTAAGYSIEGIAFNMFDHPSPTRFLLYRCYNSAGQHFLTADAGCEGGVMDGPMGYVEGGLVAGATRPIYRCIGAAGPLSTANPAECLTNGFAMQGNQGFVP